MLQKFLLTLVSAFLVTPSFACECIGMTNIQQLASYEGVLIAKVKTESVSHGGSVGQVNIQRVFKGVPPANKMEIYGQDGFNCAGGIYDETEGDWIVALFKDEEGNYGVASCAEASLRVDDPTGNTEVYFKEITSVTETELDDLINFRKVPSVLGLTCEVYTSRYYNHPGSSRVETYSHMFYDTAGGTPAAPLSVNYSIDLSPQGPEIKTFSVKADLTTTDNYNYTLNTTVTEPYLGHSFSDSKTVDIRKYYGFEETWLSASYPITEPGNTDGFAVSIDVSTSSRCTIQAGYPLKVVK